MSTLLDGLNPEQRRAAEHVDGPLLVLAGAGSGKTRVITHRIAHLVEVGVPARGILAVTFTNKAAREMRERVRRLCGPSEVAATTFHSFGALFLREEIAGLGREPTFSIYDADDSLSVIKKVIEEIGEEAEGMPAKGLRNRISGWKERALDPARVLAEASGSVERREGRVYELYEQRLVEANALDFDDLLLLPLRLLVEDESVARRWQERLTHLLIDEFQDTNLVQYRLVRALSATRRNLCVTGDPDQSIYSWRGADPGNFDRFLEEHPEALSVALERNYRSDGNILRGASELIAHNVQRIPKRLYTEGEDGESVRVVGFGDEAEEARAVVHAVQEWERQGVRTGEIAVFYRTNDLSLPIERALASSGVPYQIVGGLEFFGRQEVKDVLAYLRFLDNPSDVVSALRVLNVPPRGIGKKTQEKLLSLARRQRRSIGDLLRDPEGHGSLAARARKAVGSFTELLRTLDALPKDRVFDLIEHLLRVSGYRTYWEARADGNDPWQNVGQLLNLARELEEERRLDLRGFLEQVALISDLDRFEGASEKVSLMTLHSSKGLEFDAVVIVACEDGLLPHAMAQVEGASEEERRLLHVGMTRARRRLVLSWARRRTRFGRPQVAFPSSFLAELGEVGIERHGEWQPGSLDAFPAADADAYETPWDEEVPDPALLQLRIGARVHHADYGPGTVRRVRGRGRGLDRKIVVDFDEAGTRILIAAHANLEVLGPAGEGDYDADGLP